MFRLPFYLKKHLFIRFTQLILFFALSNIFSCDCGNRGNRQKVDQDITLQDNVPLHRNPSEKKTKISMSVKQPNLLIGDQKTTEVSFGLVDKHKSARLEKFTLQASYTQGGGKAG